MKYLQGKNGRWCSIAGLVAAALLSGCASSPYGAPVTSAPAPAPSNGPHRTPVQPEGEQLPQSAPKVDILPGSTELSAVAPAVSELLREGWVLYQQERFEASISVAERAMRIDRHQVGVYLLLSRNYLARSQLVQAKQLARQGLSINSASAVEHGQLQQLLDEIEAEISAADR